MRRSRAIHPLICPLQVVVAGTQMLAKMLLGVLQVRLNLDLNHRRKSDTAAMTCETKPRFGWLRHPTPCGWRNERAFASATRRRSRKRTR